MHAAKPSKSKKAPFSRSTLEKSLSSSGGKLGVNFSLNSKSGSGNISGSSDSVKIKSSPKSPQPIKSSLKISLSSLPAENFLPKSDSLKASINFA